MKAGFKGANRRRCTAGHRMKRLRVRITLEEGPQAGKSIHAKDWVCRKCDR